MLTLKNNSKGPRLVLMLGNQFERIMPGETRTIDGSKVIGIPDGLEEISAKAAPDRGAVPQQPEGLDQQVRKPNPPDLDGDGKPGGSLPHDPPALSAMSKAQLERQAQIEGVDLKAIKGTGKEGKLIKADIEAAIEAKRAGNAA